MKQLLSKVWEALKGHWWLKVFSLLFAFLVWSYVLSGENPIREMTVQDVPVSYVGAAELAAKNLVIDGSQTEYVETVDVTLTAAQNVHRSINKDTLNASIDLSQLNATGSYALTIGVTSPVSVNRFRTIRPGTVTVVVDRLAHREVPVEYELTGEAREGYYIGQPSIASESVYVEGAKTVVDQVAKAVCYVPVDDLTENVRASYGVTLYDYDGNEIDPEALSGRVPSAIVTLEVQRMKTVLLDTASLRESITNVKEGFQVTSVKASEESVRIIGSEEVLAQVETVAVNPVNAEKADHPVTLETTLLLPDGVVAVSGNKVQLEVDIRKKVGSRTFVAVPIEMVGVRQGRTYSAEIRTADVSIVGGEVEVTALRESDVKVYADVSDKGPGKYTVTLKTGDLPGIQPSGISISPQIITVSIK